MMALSWSTEMWRLAYHEWLQFQTDILEYVKWENKLNTIMVEFIVLITFIVLVRIYCEQLLQAPEALISLPREWLYLYFVFLYLFFDNITHVFTDFILFPIPPSISWTFPNITSINFNVLLLLFSLGRGWGEVTHGVRLVLDTEMLTNFDFIVED